MLQPDEEIDRIYEVPDTLIEGDLDIDLLQGSDVEFTVKRGTARKSK